MSRAILLLAAMLIVPGSLYASVTEIRDFIISIDGKEVGSSRLTIVQDDDGTTTMSSVVKMHIPQASTSSYEITGVESWKNQRLHNLKSTASANGKKSEVSAVAEGDRLRVRVNGQERILKNDVWTSSYWKLLDPKSHNKSLPVLDVDSGKDFNRYVQYVGAEDITISNQMVRCYHFRITGGPTPVEIWFDIHHRLVRQEFVDGGKRTVIHLAGIYR